MTVVCPLSGSSNLVRVETIQTTDLKQLYGKSLKFDISSELLNLNEIDFYQCLESDLRFFYPPIVGSESFYEKLQKFEWYYQEEKNEYDYAAKFVKPSDSVLEIGCGRGNFAKKINTQNYVGLELSRKAKELGTLNNIFIKNETIQAHAANHPENYDIVCAFQVLEHIAEPRSFIESSLACLKPGGLLIYSVPSLDSFGKYVSNFTLDMPPHHVTKWSDKALINLTKYFPIENIEIWHEPLQPIHKLFYAETIFKLLLFKLFKKNIKAIDFNLTTKIIHLFGRMMGKILAHALVYPEILPRGISVTSVYRKL